jgi:hypothetical protein
LFSDAILNEQYHQLIADIFPWQNDVLFSRYGVR